MKNLSIVIPVFNEATIIVNAIDTIVGELDAIEDLNDFELVIVDDGSDDSTWTILTEQLCGKYPQIHAIKLSRNFGKESALCAGLEYANAEAIVVMDADLQHPPALIKDMYRVWKDSAVDVVEAIKRTRGNESLASKFAAKCFYSIYSSLSGLDLRAASDFKLMDRCVVEAWKELPERNLFFRGMSAWVGFNRERILFDVAEREGSETKWSTMNLVRLALVSISAYSSAPLHLITMAGMIFLVFSLVIGISALLQYFSGAAVSGFTTVILLILITGGLVMIALGIIGEYLARIFDEVKKRPRFLISNRIHKEK